MFKFFTILLSLPLSQFAFADLTCKSVGIASCTTNVGFCVEYVPNSGDVPQLEQYCLNVNGIFEQAPCNENFNTGTCVNEFNKSAPIIRFDTHLETEISHRLCLSMNGMYCSK